MSISQIAVPYKRGYDIGIGADLASGSPMGLAVMGEVSEVHVGQGGIVQFHLERISSTSDLEKKLGISADANYGSGAFCPGVSARFDFASNAKVQSSSLFMAITAQVDLAFKQIDAPRLTEVASGLADNPQIFAQRYGNMFVRGVMRGGLFVGTFRIDTGSSETSQQIAAELSGAYGLFSASAKTKFDEVQKNFRGQISIDMYHEGGPVDLHFERADDPLELLSKVNLFLKSFADRPDESAVPFGVTLAPLTIAEAPLPPNQAQIEYAQDVIIFCAKRRSVLFDQLNTFQFICDFPAKFDFSNSVSLDTVRTALETVQADLDLIKSCASKAMNSPEAAAMPEKYAEAEHREYPKAIVPNPLPIAKPPQINTDLSKYFGTWEKDHGSEEIPLKKIMINNTDQGIMISLAHSEGVYLVAPAKWDAMSNALVMEGHVHGTLTYSTYYIRMDNAESARLKMDIHGRNHNHIVEPHDYWIALEFHRM
jgi:hypothetical protein